MFIVSICNQSLPCSLSMVGYSQHTEYWVYSTQLFGVTSLKLSLGVLLVRVMASILLCCHRPWGLRYFRLFFPIFICSLSINNLHLYCASYFARCILNYNLCKLDREGIGISLCQS